MQQILNKLTVQYRKLARPSAVWNGGIGLRISDAIHPDIVKDIYKNRYEKGERELLKSTLCKGDIVLDIGAGIGQSAIIAAQTTSAKVYAVEANPDLIPIIKENAALNGVDVEVIYGAIGAESGFADFYIEDKFFASSLAPSSSARKMEVPVIGIRDLLEKIRPNYLNMDVEGAEFDTLPLVKKSDVRCISVEIHDDNKVNTLIKSMQQNGFFDSEMHYSSLMHFC